MIKALNKNLRIISQIIFIVVFFWLFLFSTEAAKYFIYLDPVAAIHNIFADGFSIIILIPFFTILLTIVFGRIFCGWICPLGTINHFLSYLGNQNSKDFNSKLQSVKYLILIVLIILLFFGTNLFGVVDPLSLLSRGIASVYPSILNTFNISQTVSISISYLLILFIFFILYLNFHRNRFFCNILCPLGAILGIISKFSFLKLKINDKCRNCHTCGENCSYTNSPVKDFNNSECILCFNCEADCKTGKINFGLLNISKNSQSPSMPERRKVIGTIISGLLLGVLLKSESVKISKRKNVVRPPGAIKEEMFLDQCLRCGICTKVCKTGFINPAGLDEGIEILWTPVKNNYSGYCAFECNKCTTVCPTEAISELSIEDKKKFKVGTAVINKNLCYTYSDGISCTACFDACPLKDKAIKMKETNTWNYRGRLTNVKQIYISQEDCIGCGICENACVRKDMPAIFITNEDEERAQESVM